MIEVNLGIGKVFVSAIGGPDGRQGVLFRDEKDAHPIGSKDPEWDIKDKYWPKGSDVVVWCGKMESARILQDVVNTVILNLNSLTVTDAAPDAAEE